MKKILSLILIVAVLFTLSACGGPVAPTYTANWGKTDVNEKSVYTIEIAKGEANAMFKDAPELVGTGTYEVLLTGSAKTNYTQEITFNFEGYFLMNDGSKVDVKDGYTSKVTFNDVTKALAPIASEKHYKGSTISYYDGKYQIDQIEYKTTVNYENGKAKITTNKMSPTGVFDEKLANIPNSNEVSAKGYYFDNEMVFLALRSAIKGETFQSNFTVINPLTAKGTVGCGTSIAKGTDVKLQTAINGEKKELDLRVMRYGITDQGSAGQTLSLYFIANDMGAINKESGGTMNVDRSRLVKFEQNVPYSSNNFVFNLTEYSYGK